MINKILGSLALMLISCISLAEILDDRATLTWDAPTTREDGSPLEANEILIYTIYHTIENTGGELTYEISPNLSTYEIDGLSEGNHIFNITATDTLGNESVESNTVSKNIIDVVVELDEFIIDDRDANTLSVGIWKNSSGPNPQGGGSIYSSTNGDSFSWTPSMTSPALYRVEAWWTWYSNRDTSVTYEVHHTTGVDYVEYDQRNNSLAAQWNDLGSFTLNEESLVKVVHDGGAGSTTSVDAIRFTKVEPSSETPPSAPLLKTFEDLLDAISVLESRIEALEGGQ